MKTRTTIAVLTCAIAAAALSGCTNDHGNAPENSATIPAPTGSMNESSLDTGIPVDSGPRDGAQGTVVLNSHEEPYQYIVVSMDLPADIAARFGVETWDLINQNGAKLSSIRIFPGDVLTFTYQRP